MWNLQTMLILILLQVVSVLSTGKDQQENTDVATSSNVQPTNPILPLVLIIVEKDLFVRPKMITNISKTEDGKFLGGTMFSTTVETLIIDKQIYACSMGTEDTENSLQPDDQKCTYWTSFENTEPLTCNFEPEPFVEKVNVAYDPKEEHVDFPCGPEKRGKMYRFVYKVCLMNDPISNSDVLQSDSKTIALNPINRQDSFEIYQFCYNEVDKEVVYTIYQLNSVNLLRDDNLSNERRKKFPMMSDGYEYFGTHYQEIDQAYLQLEKYQSGLNEPERLSELLYQMQKLLPENYMEFALWKKPLYHFLNARLMENKQAELWNYINSLIQDDATRHGKNYGIRTGVLTLHENRGKKTPIMEKLFLPDIWLEVIDYWYWLSSEDRIVTEGIAIIMNTNPGNSAADAYFNSICEINVCETSFSEKFSEQVIKTVKCCPVTAEILKFFGFTQTIHNVLTIDLVTDINVSVEKEQRLSNTGKGKSIQN